MPGLGVARSFPDPSLLAAGAARERRAATSQQLSRASVVRSPHLCAGQPRGSTVSGWDACRALGTARARARLHGRLRARGGQATRRTVAATAAASCDARRGAGGEGRRAESCAGKLGGGGKRGLYAWRRCLVRAERGLGR